MDYEKQNPWNTVRSILLLAAAACASPALATPMPSASGLTESTTVRNVDLYPRTAAAARALLGRIDRAALSVCGASEFSLREVKTATPASACRRDAMADVVRRIDVPLVTREYARRRYAS